MNQAWQLLFKGKL